MRFRERLNLYGLIWEVEIELFEPRISSVKIYIFSFDINLGQLLQLSIHTE